MERRIDEKINEIAEAIKSGDTGKWSVNIVGENRVWFDASQIATGVILEDSKGFLIEDGSWLRKKMTRHTSI